MPKPMSMTIAGRRIGPDEPPYVIAELSANHNGDIERAFAILDMAKAAGADAIKLQTYRPDTITIDHDGPGFRIDEGPWAGRTLYELYQEAHMPWPWHGPLFARARELGLAIFSSVFDETSIDLLEELDAPAYKIASFEAVDLPLIERAARTGKPLIISTGMASPEEVADAVGAARRGGCGDLALLYCVSGYPTPAAEANLRTIPDLAARFGAVVGLSDHSLGIGVALAGVALGAAIVEKHVTLRRADGGPDSGFSLEADELAALCAGCRDAHAALGAIRYGGKASESTSKLHRRSIYSVADIAPGEILTARNIRSIRPGFGLAPKHLPDILGRPAAAAIPRGTPISWQLVGAPALRHAG
jgi:pseudaminic acid synthase